MLKLACLAALAHASPASRVTHYEGPYLNGWAKSALPVSGSGAVRFTIVLREQNMEQVRRIALEVSTPSSPEYGNFLTQAELARLTAPKASDAEAVKEWLGSEGVGFEFRTPSNIEVSTSVAKASRMLNTRFHKVTNHKHGQSIVRATDYSLPAPVHEATAAIFGLHGLPVPPTGPLVIQGIPGEPAQVTPSVLESTYKIGGVKPTGSLKNRQAVAEFQGELMSEDDLATLFKTYVKGYKAGTDDTVYKYVGAPKKDGQGVEAELDVQYIMSPAVGVKTEFWEFPASDFCNDLNLWSSNLTAMEDPPLVHSISYGWQGNLTQVHCKDADLTVVDDNFAKLAAKGISIMISSGDSGSGYSPQDSTCYKPSAGGSAGVGLTGDISATVDAQAADVCCQEAQRSAGWTFEPHSPVSAAQVDFGYSFKSSLFHTLMSSAQPGPFKPRDLMHLNGSLDGTGGSIAAKSDNRTWADTTIVFSGPETQGPEIVFNISASFDGKTYSGVAVFVSGKPPFSFCEFLRWQIPGGGDALWEGGNNPPPPPPPGRCTIYSKVTGTTHANSSTISAQNAGPPKVVLWPSWPASSPWVTAVGATRFVGQKVGAEEMASDQFGSGGGFSKQFAQEPHAKWQEAAVAAYLSTVEPSSLPPAGAFPAKGRATPDVSALGEGYQVIVGGKAQSVGGTSASSPAFAAMVSLLNEARLNGGKKQLGFLNPFLYANAAAFTDVVKGSNKIDRGGQPTPYGYNCTKGWDPATGLGTPQFDKLLAAAMA